MSILLKNALLVDLDPIRVEAGSLRIEGEKIVERGISISPPPGDEVIDCGGAVLLPGLVNGHTHLYSALAVGMPSPSRTPKNFREILELVWWRLDQALDAKSNEMSARIGAIEALRCGTTTLIDHHASPRAIEGSLDSIERGINDVGLRGVLCYETTDRHGRDGRIAGLEENRRYLEKCAGRNDGRFAALVGAHASFTLEDESLEQLSALANEYKTGVHIHVAEDPCDETELKRHITANHAGLALIERFSKHGLLKKDSIFAHGTHLGLEAVARVNEIDLTMAHNARSNMNNAVGYAPVAKFECPVMLGTDGIGGDMFAESKAAWFISRHQHAGLTTSKIIEMLAASARRASAALGITLGKLDVGAAADIVVTDYIPFTPLTVENIPGHFFFSMDSRHVRDVIVAGRRALKDRMVQLCDELKVRRAAASIAIDLWKTMASITA